MSKDMTGRYSPLLSEVLC